MSTRSRLKAGLLIPWLGCLWAAAPSPASAQDNFVRRTVATQATPGAGLFARPTTVAIHPDGRLFVGQFDGRIHVFTLDAGLRVTAVQRIDTIHDLNPLGRLVTGIAFGPGDELFVSHSDGRVYDDDIDINSGTVTKLFPPSYTSGAVVAENLPRSKADHAPNGLAFGPDGMLYLSVGGFTNAGLPSQNFKNQPEVARSGAILRIDPGSGDVSVHATGFRNAYDILWHSNGNLYANDNGANMGSGNQPNSDCSAPGSEAGDTTDKLDRVLGGGYYGHPNPSRLECVLRGGPGFVPPLHEYGLHTSSDGIAEFTGPLPPGFGGNLLTANFGTGDLVRVVLSGDGTEVVGASTLAGGFANPLDVAVGAYGTIFVAEHNQPRITALRPLVSFQTENGQWYLVAESGGGGPVLANRTAAGSWEKFSLLDLNGGDLMDGDSVQIQVNNGMFVVAEQGGGSVVNANRIQPFAWETFTIWKVGGSGVINNNDLVALKSIQGCVDNSGCYVSAEEGGGGAVNANRDAIGPWEAFRIIMH